MSDAGEIIRSGAEASSVEKDESLQDLWAGLLATASEQSDSLSPSSVETLKQLTPGNARGLSALFDFFQQHKRIGLETINSLFEPADNASAQLMTEAFERLGLIRRQYDLQMQERGLFSLTWANEEDEKVP
jgi:hypothetical protein